jgi:hypothetical protein
MSVYAMNAVCRDVMRDKTFREAMKADPRAALAGRDLTDEEREAFFAGDVAKLHRLGANDFLMGYLARYGIAGLNVENYATRIRSVAN